MFSSALEASLQYVHGPLVLVPSMERLLKERYPRFVFDRYFPRGKGFDASKGTVHISVFRPPYLRQGDDLEPMVHELAHCATLSPKRILVPNFGLPAAEVSEPPTTYAVVNMELRVQTYVRNFLAWLPESNDPDSFVYKYTHKQRPIEVELIDPTGKGFPWVGVAALVERDGRDAVANHIAEKYAKLQSECSADRMLERLDLAHQIVVEAAVSTSLDSAS